MFEIGKKLNTAAASWGWFLCWLKQDKGYEPISIKDDGADAIIKVGDRKNGGWLPVNDAIDILRTFFKYHYIHERSYGMFMTPEGFEQFADEWWKELLSVIITNGKDEIIIRKY